MNEKPNKNRIFIFVGIVLLIWAVGATGISIFFHGRYSNLQSIVDAAGGSELVELVEQQRETITTLQNDLVTAADHIRAGIEYGAELEGSIERAYRYAEFADAELADFGNTMASYGSTIQSAIYLQQRTIEFVGRIEAINSAIKVELGMRP